jgi:hypothetical protein
MIIFIHFEILIHLFINLIRFHFIIIIISTLYSIFEFHQINLISSSKLTHYFRFLNFNDNHFLFNLNLKVNNLEIINLFKIYINHYS